MVELLRVLLIAFSVYRLSSLIASEEGPYLPFLYKDSQQNGVFKWLRMRAGAYSYGPDGKPESNLGRGISCSLCVGAYVTLLMLAIMSFPNIVTTFISLWLGIWGVQTFLENLTSDEAISEAIEEVAENIDERD